MTPRPDNPIDRRRFFRNAARGAAVAAIASTAAVLGRRRPDPQKQSCQYHSLCRGCPILTGCQLPQAYVFRDATQGDQS